MMKKFNEIKHLPEFDKDMKKLKKKFRSLDEDLTVFTNAQLYPFHKEQIENEGTVRITGLGIDSPPIYKSKKFTCKALKGEGVRSGIRVIHAYFKDDDRIEFIEIYHKNNKENEDSDRIKDFFLAPQGRG